MVSSGSLQLDQVAPHELQDSLTWNLWWKPWVSLYPAIQVIGAKPLPVQSAKQELLDGELGSPMKLVEGYRPSRKQSWYQDTGLPAPNPELP